jgi:hypothetical protein
VGTNWIQRFTEDRKQAALHVDKMLLAVGRCLEVAQRFEQNARSVTWAAHASLRLEVAEGDGVEDLFTILSSTPYPQLIGPAIATLKNLEVFDAAYLQTLKKAKDARNAIAHEAALIPRNSVADLATHAAKLISWLDDIQAADISLSKAAHDIEEPKDPLPLRVFEENAATQREDIVRGLTPLMSSASEKPS